MNVGLFGTCDLCDGTGVPRRTGRTHCACPAGHQVAVLDHLARAHPRALATGWLATDLMLEREQVEAACDALRARGAISYERRSEWGIDDRYWSLVSGPPTIGGAA